MRIDKFLWCVRIYKTRSVAADEIKKNRVSVAGSPVKSSKEIKVGDIVKIKKSQIEYQIKIIEIPKNRIGAKLVPLHIEDKTDRQEYEILRLKNLSQDYYRAKGEGRPTKKDRRNLEGFSVGIESDIKNSDWDLFFSGLDEAD